MRMGLSKAIILGSLLAPMSLLAQDAASTATASTKTATGPSIFQNAYGKLDVRHYFVRKSMDTNSNKLKYEPKFQPRLYLGSKFFNDKLMSQFIFGVTNSYGAGKNSSLAEDRGTEWENELTVWKNDYIAFVPFLYIQFPSSTAAVRKPTKAELGLDIPMGYPIKTAAGTITLQTELAAKTFLASKPDADDAVELQDRNGNGVTNAAAAGFGLAGADASKKDESYKTEVKGRSLYHWFSYGVKYEPSFVAGLEATAMSIFETTYTPIMELDEGTKTTQVRSAGGPLGTAYSKKFEPTYLFLVKYAFSPEYSISNEFRLLDRDQGQRKYQNMVSVVAKLF